MRTVALSLLVLLLAVAPQVRGDQRERDKVKADATLRSRLAWRDANQTALSGGNRRIPRAPAVTLTEQAKLVGTSREQYDWDGSSVAISGNSAVVGGDGDAYVFVRNGSTWTLQATLTPGDNSFGAFGSSVAIDGDTILVGAWLADGARYVTGAVYVFARVGTSWISQGKIWANDGEVGDEFGYTVALSGNTALVGAPDANSNKGAAYVFVRTGSAWSQQAKLIASDAATDDRLTWPAGLALTGDTAVLGAYYERTAAYVFVRNGSSWSQQAKLVPSDASIAFGRNVATHGNLAVFNTGHVFERVGGTWFQRENFSDSKSSVAFNGTRILAGDKYADGKVSGSGAAYTYRLVNGYWTEEAKLIASDGAYIDIFGDAVGLAGDYAIVGAPYDDDLGSAYAFQLPGATSAGNALRLVAVTPCRVADTRTGQGKTGAFGPPTMNAGQVREFPIPASSCGIPATAKAYSLNITVVPAGPLYYLTIWPTGVSQPLVSTLNSFEGKIVANAAIVPAGTNGSVNVFVTGKTDVIVDINGFFAP